MDISGTDRVVVVPDREHRVVRVAGKAARAEASSISKTVPDKRVGVSLDLDLYPYLPRVTVKTTRATDYMALLSGRAA